jgi:hypothetical protein
MPNFIVHSKGAFTYFGHGWSQGTFVPARSRLRRRDRNIIGNSSRSGFDVNGTGEE